MSLLKFTYKQHCDFLKDYGFVEQGFNRSSHNTFIGRINGEDRTVFTIFNNYEKKHQSDKTMRFSVQNSGIPKKYYTDWKISKIVHKEIIF